MEKILFEHPECEFLNKMRDNYHLFNEIFSTYNSFITKQGSYLFECNKYTYCDKYYSKHKLLFDTAKKCDSVLQTDDFMCHSIIIMLMANPNIKITCIHITDQYYIII